MPHYTVLDSQSMFAQKVMSFLEESSSSDCRASAIRRLIFEYIIVRAQTKKRGVI